MDIKQMKFNFKNEWFSMQLIEAWILSDLTLENSFIYFILCKALLLILCCENIFIGFANGKIIEKENADCKGIKGNICGFWGDINPKLHLQEFHASL
jgi:hypothetical protein